MIILGLAIVAFAVTLAAVHAHRGTLRARHAYWRVAGYASVGAALVVNSSLPTVSGILAIAAGGFGVMTLFMAFRTRKQ